MVKTIEIRGANAFDTFSRVREGCRGIVIRDGRMLISHEVNVDCCLIPGGGLEEGETPENCCVREIGEETGYIVRPTAHFLTLKEYYEEYQYVSHYFLCDVIGITAQNLTANEIKRGLTPVWIEPEKMLRLFARHQDYAATNEERRGAYLREFTALTEYFRMFGA